jgi:hypothetical protein
MHQPAAAVSVNATVAVANSIATIVVFTFLLLCWAQMPGWWSHQKARMTTAKIAAVNVNKNKFSVSLVIRSPFCGCCLQSTVASGGLQVLLIRAKDLFIRANLP